MENNKLGRLFRGKRIAMLVTLSELATAADVPVAELQRLETGDYVPTNGCLERIARALSLEVVPAMNSAAPTLLSPNPECEESHLQRLHTNV